MLLLIHCFFLFCPCFVVQYSGSFLFAIISLRERELAVLPYVSPWCPVAVRATCLFITAPWIRFDISWSYCIWK